jgi:phosphatidylethanolamine/phosphatidyl-N-methylethanolamine N-methyltransferase
MHNLLEKRSTNKDFNKVLEIGAHKAEHLQYIKHFWKSYNMVDLVLPEKEILNQLPTGATFDIANAEKLPWSDNYFDRVVITCVLHHITYPEEALIEARRVLCMDGQMDILLPNDPGFIYRTIKYFTSNISALRFIRANNEFKISKFLEIRYAMKLFHIREHRNHVEQLRVLIMHTFRDDMIETRYWPFGFKSWNLGIFTLYSIKKLN